MADKSVQRVIFASNLMFRNLIMPHLSSSQNGVTALSMAAQEQHTAVVEELILAGANLDLANDVRTVVGKYEKELMYAIFR